jgi:hypothetical protein
MTVFPLLKSALELTSVIGRSDEYPGFGLCQIYLQVSISPTFYVRLFRTKVSLKAFLY